MGAISFSDNSSVNAFQSAAILQENENDLISEEINSPKASTEKNSFLSKTALSAFAGLKAVFMTSGAFLIGGRFVEQRFNSVFLDEVIALSCIAGVAMASKTFYSLSKENNIESPIEVQPSPSVMTEATLDVSPTPTDLSLSQATTRIAILDKVMESLKIGWKGYASSLITAIAVSEFTNRGFSPAIIAGSAFAGTGLAFRNSMIKPAEKDETESVSKLKILGRSLFQGVLDGAATLGSLVTLKLVVDGISNTPYYAGRQYLEMAYVLVPGIVSAIYSFIRRSAEEAIQKDNTDWTPQNRWELKKLGIRLAKSLGDGVFASTAAGYSFIMMDTIGKNPATLLVPSLVAAIGSGAHTCFSHISSSYKNQSEKIGNAFTNGLKAFLGYSAASLPVSLLFHDVIRNNLSQAHYRNFPFYMMGGSAVLGTCHAIGSYMKPEGSIQELVTAPVKGLFNVTKAGFSKITNTWKEASKLKKATMVSLSMVALTALGVLYVGPETALNEATRVGDEIYNKLAFEEKFETSTVKLGDLIGSYNDFDEMVRLASLAKNPDRPLNEVSCAEILNTCHLEADDKTGHKKIHINKLLKFHPDKNRNHEELARMATQVLNRANIDLKNGNCPGQDESGCLMNENELEVTKILRKPRSFLDGILEESCTFVIDETPNKMTMDYCKDIK